MKKTIGYGTAFCLIFAAGCARGPVSDIRETTESNQKILRENEQRLEELESSLSALTSEIEKMNNRVYEVRTRNGQKTSMRVVAVAPAPVATASPAPAARSASQPVGKVIDPAASPAPLAARKAAAPKPPAPRQAAAAKPAGASGSVGQPERVAGPSGQIAPASGEIGLPPAYLPSQENEGTSIVAPATNVTTIPVESGPTVPAGNMEAASVPVPPIPSSDISLPPEHPDLPPMPDTAQQAQTQPGPAPAAASAPAAAPASAARANANPRSEQAAYNAALNAARAGRTNEGIRLFNEFLRQYPNSRYTANADYWIGECLYAQGKYHDALNSFQTVNNSFPTHHKNADALLKAGMTLNKLGDNAGAQEKYRTLISSFPNTEAARRARALTH